MQGHYIVCGLGIVGYRVVELLHRLGEKVRVVTLSGHDDRIQATRAAGVEVEIADARDPNVLRRLGILEARALVVTTSKDVVNVEIALDAQRLRADLPIVMRLFDQNLARQLESAFQRLIAVGIATEHNRDGLPSLIQELLFENGGNILFDNYLRLKIKAGTEPIVFMGVSCVAVDTAVLATLIGI